MCATHNVVLYVDFFAFSAITDIYYMGTEEQWN